MNGRFLRLGSHCDRVLCAFYVDDEAKRTVQGVHAVASSAVEVEHDPCCSWFRTPESYALDQFACEDHGVIAKGGEGGCVRQIDIHARRLL